MTIGERIKNLRSEGALSQQDLGEKLGISRQAISKWELNISEPDTDNIVALARVFNVSTDYILTGSEAYEEEDKLEKKNLIQDLIYYGAILFLVLGGLSSLVANLSILPGFISSSLGSDSFEVYPKGFGFIIIPLVIAIYILLQGPVVQVLAIFVFRKFYRPKNQDDSYYLRLNSLDIIIGWTLIPNLVFLINSLVFKLGVWSLNFRAAGSIDFKYSDMEAIDLSIFKAYLITSICLGLFLGLVITGKRLKVRKSVKEGIYDYR